MSSILFESEDFEHGYFEPENVPEFVLIDSNFTYRDLYMHAEAYTAFLEMAKAAANDSINLKIISATRNFEYQKNLWENKWTGKSLVNKQKANRVFTDPFIRAKKIMEYSAPPGYSRHHWGTDIDLNSVEDEYFQTEEGIKVYSWLKKNAGNFGFCQTYNGREEGRENGFEEEKWHWSYMPLADKIWLKQIERFDKSKISGFKGEEQVRKLDLLNNYLKAINRSY